MPRKPGRSNDNALRVVFVRTHDQMAHAYAVRSICFMEETGLNYAHAHDGNDFHASHVVFYLGEEPIGATRIRYFNGFAKLERTGFRRDYRNIRILQRCAEAVFAHIARKGYQRVLIFAERKYANIYTRFLGMTRVNDTLHRRPSEETDFFELKRDLVVPPDAITEATDIKVLIRTEGAWDVPASFG